MKSGSVLNKRSSERSRTSKKNINPVRQVLFVSQQSQFALLPDGWNYYVQQGTKSFTKLTVVSLQSVAATGT